MNVFNKVTLESLKKNRTRTIVTIIGIPLGVLTLSYMLDAMAGEYEMMAVVSPFTYAIGVVLTLGMSLLVSLLVARKNRRIDMVESLKGAERSSFS